MKYIRIVIYIFALIGFVMISGYIAMRFGWTKTSGVVDNQHDYFQKQITNDDWKNTDEWRTLKQAILKDKEIINKVSKETGIPSRVIVAPLVVEQMRLFYSEREVYKQIFAPLKILGNQSQFSWGVMGIKKDTAEQIEKNLKDTSSPWYLSKDFENVLDFKTDNHDSERFERLTDENSRYYSYLYGALYIKQIENQWSKAGFPIYDRPEIISTLFNIGFNNSKPNNNPLSGGAEIEINKTTYSFGGFALSFYNSNELVEEFPLTLESK